jgi:hypothetical protein
MNKRHLTFIYLLLIIIGAMQIYIIRQTNNIQMDMYNGGNYISDKIDHLTSIVNTHLID